MVNGRQKITNDEGNGVLERCMVADSSAQGGVTNRRVLTWHVVAWSCRGWTMYRVFSKGRRSNARQ